MYDFIRPPRYPPYVRPYSPSYYSTWQLDYSGTADAYRKLLEEIESEKKEREAEALIDNNLSAEENVTKLSTELREAQRRIDRLERDRNRKRQAQKANERERIHDLSVQFLDKISDSPLLWSNKRKMELRDAFLVYEREKADYNRTYYREKNDEELGQFDGTL